MTATNMCSNFSGKWDSPQTGRIPPIVTEYLKDMVKKNGEPDLMIFALTMRDVFCDEDAEAIRNISNAFW